MLGLINHVFDARAEDGAVGITAVLHRGRIVFIGDTLVHEWPDARSRVGPFFDCIFHSDDWRAERAWVGESGGSPDYRPVFAQLKLLRGN